MSVRLEAMPDKGLKIRSVRPKSGRMATRMFMQFFFGYLVNRYPYGTISTMRINYLLQESLMSECATCTYKVCKALYAVPRVCLQSEVYFGLYTTV